MSVICSKCGMENDDANDVCRSCGSVLISTISLSRTTANSVLRKPRYENLKQYALEEGDDGDVKRVRNAHIVLYIIGIFNIIFVLVYNLLVYDSFISDDLSFLDGFLILAMAIWMHLSYSPIAAIVAFVLMLAELICSLVFFHEIPWLIVVACVDCAIAIAKTRSLSEGYKTYKKKTLSGEINRYVKDEKNLREEKLKSISLKDGYQFASIPSRIFAEKIDVPGSYCCPYCYAEVSSDVSSMCANCGKSLGADATTSFSPALPQVPTSQPEQSNATSADTAFVKETHADESSAVKKNLFKSKKLWIGVGIGVAVLAVALGVIFIVNEGIPHRKSNNLTDENVKKLEKEIERLEKAIAESSNNNAQQGNVEDEELFDDVWSSGSNRLFVGSILRCDDNLRLRARENTDSAIITTMVKHTKVQILDIGKEDESEGVESNWVLVEVLPGGKDRDGKRIPDGTTGWCFGGFLEPFSE